MQGGGGSSCSGLLLLLLLLLLAVLVGPTTPQSLTCDRLLPLRPALMGQASPMFRLHSPRPPTPPGGRAGTPTGARTAVTPRPPGVTSRTTTPVAYVFPPSALRPPPPLSTPVVVTTAVSSSGSRGMGLSASSSSTAAAGLVSPLSSDALIRLKATRPSSKLSQLVASGIPHALPYAHTHTHSHPPTHTRTYSHSR